MDDHSWFEELYRAHADRVHAYARRRSDHATADEVVAEVFLAVWRRPASVPADPLPWLLGIARRTLANQRRSAQRRAALSARLERDAPVPAATESSDDELLHAIATLPRRDREVLLLIAWEGLSHAEVATVLGIARPAVAARLHRARRRLTNALTAQRQPTEVSR